jgi:hypothetical protein
MSVCDELEGRPRSHVTRFQAIAPSNAADTMPSDTSDVWRIPSAIVVATSSERNAPTTLSVALRSTAIRGGSAPVAIDVAIAFAVS